MWFGQQTLDFLCDVVNLMLAGRLNKEINTFLFGGRLTISKKYGDVSLIAVVYTLRRLRRNVHTAM